MTTPRPGLLLGISVLWVPLAFLFDGVTVLMLPLRVGGDAGTLGIVSFVGLAIAAGLQPVAGWLSDRVRDRIDRRVFVAAALVPAIIGIWIFAGTTGLVGALVGYVVLQVAATAVQAGQQTLIPEHVAGAARGRASGFKAALDVGGSFVAFLVLGALLASGGLVAAAGVTTVALVAALVIVFLLVPRARPVGPARSGALEVPAGFGSLVAARFLFLFATYAVGRFLVLLVGERLGIAPERAVDEAGWLLALFTLTTAIGAVGFGWVADRWSTRDTMVVGALVAAAGILVLAPSAGLAGVIAGGVLMALGTAAFVTGNWAATTALVPAGEAGRLMAIANLGTGLAAASAGLLGLLIDRSGFVPALLIAAAASAASIMPLAGRLPRPRPARESAT